MKERRQGWKDKFHSCFGTLAASFSRLTGKSNWDDARALPPSRTLPDILRTERVTFRFADNTGIVTGEPRFSVPTLVWPRGKGCPSLVWRRFRTDSGLMSQWNVPQETVQHDHNDRENRA